MEESYTKFFLILLSIVLTLVFGYRIKDKRKRKVTILSILLVISLAGNRSIYWLIYFDGPYYGYVVDAETGDPIEGAAVAGMWDFDHYFITMLYSFANAKETTTDKNGKYKLPLTFAFTFYPISALLKMQLLVYKPGYDSYPPAIRRKMDKPVWVEHTSPKSTYYVGRWSISCEARQECLVELNKTVSIEERQDAYSRIASEYPDYTHHYKKIKNIITAVDNDSKYIQKVIRNNRRLPRKVQSIE